VVDIALVDTADVTACKQPLAALAALDLTELPNRAEADSRLAELIPNRSVRAFLLQPLRADGDAWRWHANLDRMLEQLPADGAGVADAPPFDTPVLWIAGEQSTYVAAAAEPRMRELCPRTILVTIKGAGHWVHSQQPKAFTSAVRTFLSAD